jgi:hypothetical protein
MQGLAYVERAGDAQPMTGNGELQDRDASQRRRVRVWFGEHVIADHTAEPALAQRYAAAMERRFAGLRVTIDDVPSAAGAIAAAGLPAERIWALTAK